MLTESFNQLESFSIFTSHCRFLWYFMKHLETFVFREAFSENIFTFYVLPCQLVWFSCWSLCPCLYYWTLCYLCNAFCDFVSGKGNCTKNGRLWPLREKITVKLVLTEPNITCITVSNTFQKSKVYLHCLSCRNCLISQQYRDWTWHKLNTGMNPSLWQLKGFPSEWLTDWWADCMIHWSEASIVSAVFNLIQWDD